MSRHGNTDLNFLFYIIACIVQYLPLCQYTLVLPVRHGLFRARNGLLQNLVQLCSLSLSLLLCCVHLHLVVLVPEGGTSANPQLPSSTPQANERIELRKKVFSIVGL